MIKTNIVERTQTYKFEDCRIKVEFKDGLLDRIVLMGDQIQSKYYIFKSEMELEETIENLQKVLEDINNG